MHRYLQSNTPLSIYEYSDRLEIMNAGGLYGNARPENFPTINDYRNPIIAGAMKTLGYMNMYNRGIGQVQDELQHNGNPLAEFNVNLITAFAVEVRKGTSQGIRGHKITGHKGTSQNIEGHKSEDKPFGKNILSLQERIVDFCAVPRSMAEITAFLGVKDVRKARERYITPQLGVTLQRTIPDAPTSRNQKCVNILADLEKLKEEGLI